MFSKSFILFYYYILLYLLLFLYIIFFRLHRWFLAKKHTPNGTHIACTLNAHGKWIECAAHSGIRASSLKKQRPQAHRSCAENGHSLSWADWIRLEQTELFGIPFSLALRCAENTGQTNRSGSHLLSVRTRPSGALLSITWAATQAAQHFAMQCYQCCSKLPRNQQAQH